MHTTHSRILTRLMFTKPKTPSLQHNSEIPLHVTELLYSDRTGLLRKLELKNQKILRRILVAVKVQVECRRSFEDITTCVMKRRLILWSYVSMVT